MTTLSGFSDDEEFSDDDGIEELDLNKINGTDEKSVPTSPKASNTNAVSASSATSSSSSMSPNNTSASNTTKDKNNSKSSSEMSTTSEASPSETSKSETNTNADSDNEETEKSEDNSFFTPTPATAEAVTFDELYNTESREELVNGLKKSDLVKPAIKILVVGVSPEYIKFEPTRDVFGFLMSKDQKERSGMYQTNTCTAAIQHVNVPSLNTKLTLDENKLQDIFAAAVAEDAASIMQKLKSDGLVTLDGDKNTTVSIAPSTPYLEMLFTESKEGGGMVHILAGDKMTNAFNFMKCKSLLVDDTSPKKVYLSSILNSLADSGAENIAIVNLSSNSDNSTNVMSLGPSNEPTASDDEDTTSDEEETPANDEEEEKEKSASAPVLESDDESEDEASPPLEVENNNENSDEEKEEKETSAASEDESDDEGSAPTPIKLGADNNLNEEDVTVVEPSKTATPAATPQTGGKQTKKNKLKLKLKPILKKTRSKK